MVRRIVVGLLGGPVTLYILYVGGPSLTALMLLIAVLAAVEYSAVARLKGHSVPRAVMILGTGAFVLDAALFHGTNTSLVLGAILLASLSFPVLRRSPRDGFAGPALGVMATVYCGWSLSHLILIRTDFADAGAGFAVLAVVTVWLCDIGAFFIGSAFGKRRIAPALSPKKSLEGCIAGLAFAVGGSVAMNLLARQFGLWFALPLADAAGFGVLMGIAAQIGDLAESAMKRDVGIKDTGSLLPGHGGMLDRADSLFFSAPLAYYVLMFIASRHPMF